MAVRAKPAGLWRHEAQVDQHIPVAPRARAAGPGEAVLDAQDADLGVFGEGRQAAAQARDVVDDEALPAQVHQPGRVLRREGPEVGTEEGLFRLSSSVRAFTGKSWQRAKSSPHGRARASH
jgi:hypothetical protein